MTQTPKRKAAGGYKTTTATTSNATLIIAVCEQNKRATARFIPRFEWVLTAMMAAIMALVVWGVL